MTVVTYDRVAQRENAMQQANATRKAIAEFKQNLRVLSLDQGCRHVAQTLTNLDPDDLVGAIRVFPLLVAIKRMGARKAHDMLYAADIRNYDKRIRDLTPRQRTALAAQLRLKALS